jgi:LytS/YehU family sensor histidine kinase
VPWQQLLAWSLVDWYSCALFIPLFVLMVRRAPLERGSWRKRLPLYLIATIVASVAKYVLVTPIQQKIFGMQRTLVAVLATSALSELMIFWAVLGALHAVLFYLRYREREAVELQLRAALSESQLQALRAQLHPHFLFNTLNAATALIHRDPDAADSMLTRLGELLRLTLRADPGHEIALRDELQVLERYIDIMRVRFTGQLAVTCNIPAELEGARVPSFVLQPLVENALEHGVARLDGPGCVTVNARRDGDCLVLSVRDDGPADASAPREKSGIGLANTRARLHELYGDAATLTLAPGASGGMLAELRLPYRNAVPA